ncbi:MAG: hypothetical protein AABY96_06660 [Nitrospirota bacterium]
MTRAHIIQEIQRTATGEDETYFLNLREFASLVRTTSLGDRVPFVTYDLVKTDVLVFMQTFLRSTRSHVGH